MSQISTQKLSEGIHFSFLPESRYKTSRLSVTILLPIEAQTVAANAVLPYLLCRGNKNYPDFTLLNRKLDSLYGAELSANVDKFGEMQALTLSIETINDKFAVGGEQLAAESARLLADLLLAPMTEEGSFAAKDYEPEKANIIQLIMTEENDKRKYALNRCISVMCKNERFGIYRYGSQETVSALDGKTLGQAWQHALQSARIEILCTGMGGENAGKVFTDSLAGLKRVYTAPPATKILGAASKVTEEIEQQAVAQAKLVMGYRVKSALPADTAAQSLMTCLYGGSAVSRLFKNVREKLSLCYYCSARYNKYKGIMLIDSGILEEKREAAEAEIKKQLDIVAGGDYEDEELLAAKMYLENIYKGYNDSPAQLERFWIDQIISGTNVSPEEAAARLAVIGRAEIDKAARDCSLDTIYFLKGNGGQAHA